MRNIRRVAGIVGLLWSGCLLVGIHLWNARLHDYNRRAEAWVRTSLGAVPSEIFPDIDTNNFIVLPKENVRGVQELLLAKDEMRSEPNRLIQVTVALLAIVSSLLLMKVDRSHSAQPGPALNRSPAAPFGGGGPTEGPPPVS